MALKEVALQKAGSQIKGSRSQERRCAKRKRCIKRSKINDRSHMKRSRIKRRCHMTHPIAVAGLDVSAAKSRSPNHWGLSKSPWPHGTWCGRRNSPLKVVRSCWVPRSLQLLGADQGHWRHLESAEFSETQKILQARRGSVRILRF